MALMLKAMQYFAGNEPEIFGLTVILLGNRGVCPTAFDVSAAARFAVKFLQGRVRGRTRPDVLWGAHTSAL